MAGNWVSKALGKTQAVTTDDSAHAQSAMTSLLIQGRNSFGDEIYAFIEMPMGRIEEVKKHLTTGQNFLPSHYGTVVAAGRGKPSPDVIDEVGVPQYMIYFDPSQMPGTQQPQQRGGY